MKASRIANQKVVTWTSVILVALCLALSLLWVNTRPAPQVAVTKTVSIELDHKTYTTLVALRDDKYYPLAGGSAVALKGPSDTFTLPVSVSGEKSFEVSDVTF